jgi:hypothetical protein
MSSNSNAATAPRRSPHPKRSDRIARSLFPFNVLASGKSHNAQASFGRSQFLTRTPSLFAPFTRLIPAACSGLRNPESAASYASRRIAESGTFKFRAAGFDERSGRVTFWRCWNRDLEEWVDVDPVVHAQTTALLDRALAHQRKLATDKFAAAAEAEAQQPLDKFEVASKVARVAPGKKVVKVVASGADPNSAIAVDPAAFDPRHFRADMKPVALVGYKTGDAFGGFAFGHDALRGADPILSSQAAAVAESRAAKRWKAVGRRQPQFIQ